MPHSFFRCSIYAFPGIALLFHPPISASPVEAKTQVVIDNVKVASAAAALTGSVQSFNPAGLKINPRMHKSIFSSSHAAVQNTSWRNDVVRKWSAAGFVENCGQIADTEGVIRSDIRYAATVKGIGLYFRSTGVSAVFRGIDKCDSFVGGSAFKQTSSNESALRRIDMELAGCNMNPNIRAEGELDGVFHFYLPHCPKGISGARRYSRLVYESIYENIDLEYILTDGRLKSNFIIHPGGRAENIRLKHKGAESVRVTAEGALNIDAQTCGIELEKPTARQSNAEVNSTFYLHDNTAGFLVANYDSTRILVINPWSTYYGGGNIEEAAGITADEGGNIFITGTTYSEDFPATDTSRFSGGTRDAFIVKFNRSGVAQWAAFYGGKEGDAGRGVATDGAGNCVISGSTNSPDLPVTNSSTHAGADDAFIAKFNGNGAMIWATYYGGSNGDKANGVAVDATGNVVFTGETESADFPVTDASSNSGGWDSFVVKLDGDGDVLWARHFGGSAADRDSDVAVDSKGNVIIAGTTYSADLNVTNSSTHAGGLCDQFIVKFNSSGGVLWAAYFGGGNQDRAYSVAVDRHDNIVVAGDTKSTNIPVTNSSTNAGGNSDALAAKFSSSGALIWATYFGGGGYDTAHGAATDENGNAIIAGRTQSTNLPVTNSTFHIGGVDVFVVKFDNKGDIIWSTYYGGRLGDHAQDVTVDASNNVVITGNTESIDFPVTNSSTNSGRQDIFVVLFDANGPVSIEETSSIHGRMQLDVFPVPASDFITVNCMHHGNASARLAVYSLLGKEVAFAHLPPAGRHMLTMNTSSLAPGTYLIELKSGEVSKAKRIILSK